MSREVCSKLSGSNLMKVSALFDIKCEKVFAIVGSNCLEVSILFYLFGQILIYCML